MEDGRNHIAYKYRIYPTPSQKHFLAVNFGCCRFIYNQALNWRTIAYNADGTSLNYKDTNLALTQVKKFYPWLREADSASLQMSLRHLDTAFVNFFKNGAGYPSFKNKRSRQSYTTPMNGNSIKVTDKTITLPKVGALAYVKHRKVLKGGALKSGTVSMEPDGCYYISLCYEYPEVIRDAPIDKTRAIGLDMSMEHFFVDSNGDFEDVPHFYRRMETRLAKEQAKLSLMKRGSNNYRKQRHRIAKLYAKAKHQRSDYLHKLAYRLVMEYDIICIEDLNMKGMSQSLNLGKSVHDLGWGMFIRMLEHKCCKFGKELVKVGKLFPSSKTCNKCGHVNKGLTLSDRVYICPKCGSFIDRDWNAALNILKEGLRIYHAELVSAA